MKQSFFYGYRTVNKGERVLPNDEIDLMGNWCSVGTFCPSGRISDGSCVIRRKIDPGVGYEILPPGTLVQVGDEYVGGNREEPWSKSTGPDNGEVTANGGITYRRKVAVECGADHRFLVPGETLESGDECFSTSRHQWEPVHHGHGRMVTTAVIRRRVKQPREYPTAVTPDVVKIVGDDYRLLKIGETVTGGADGLVKGTWERWPFPPTTVTVDSKAFRVLKDVEIGEGYRTLSDSETIEAGDEYWVVCITDNNRKWARACCHLGKTVAEAKKWWFGGCTGADYKLVVYRRKLKVDVKVDAGAGYRLLAKGECMLKGDEFFAGGKWQLSCCTKTVPDPADVLDGSRYPYRRKVEAPKVEANHFPLLTISPLGYYSVEELQAEIDRRQYRMLDVGEDILRGDEFLSWNGGPWKPVTVAAGERMTLRDVGQFRRKK